VVWATLVVLAVVEMADELGWIGGPSSLYRIWIHDLVMAAAAALMVVRAALEPVARRAWLAFGGAMAVWCLGSVLWSIVYGGSAHPPYPTFADIFWLAWYPLTVAGMASMIRVRFDAFELHRWLDGVAVMLIVLVAGFALVVQPLVEQSDQGWLAVTVDFSYPVLDVLLVGAVLGVYGLLGWKPDAVWILIGAAVLAMTIGDAEFAVQEARGVADSGHYDFVWTFGAVLLAFAAWVGPPGGRVVTETVTGMRAVALALIAQALTIGIQIYAVFREVGRSERVVTAVVLVVASVQIILTRPRAEPAGGNPRVTDQPHAGTTRGGPEPG
jgi:hypothetical protein